MVTIRRETHIDAPTERVFDLARSVDLQREASTLAARPVAGAVSDLSAPGESTRWRVSVFGKRFELTTKVTAYSRPNHFRRTMTDGPLESLVHDYFFAFEDADDPEEGTVLRDVFTFRSPFGVAGAAVDPIVERWADAYLEERDARIKRVAESDDWKRYLEE
jgi:ligand-binding SRPBCC domain-containing protein